MKLTNQYNRMIYKIWSPVYDAVLGGFFNKGRVRSIAVATLQPGEKVLLVGVGTGSDLPLLPQGVSAVGTDISEPMLTRAKAKLPLPGRDISLLQGDAMDMAFADGTFDVILMNLILSVVPDPGKCMAEALRVLRPNGRIVIFDKFLPDGAKPALRRRLANLGSTLAGTDINRRLGDILKGLPVRIVHDEPSILGGMYRVVLLKKI
ncbi:MAG: methyltransferase domain-containing protein [Deltaproteobacteria bacterium]|nr:methyltransferase domain-containing protein [Deltaproteobacteria bacterium]